MSNSTLQELARQAKNRIKSGYWKQEQNVVSNKVLAKSETKDKAMYEIVASIIDGEEIVTNPLARLMNKEYYDSLDESGRCRYVLNLSNEYLRMSEEYRQLRKIS